jgi:hypothetical protein
LHNNNNNNNNKINIIDMRTNEEIKKLDFEQLGECADAHSVLLETQFNYKDIFYIARCIYYEGGFGLDDIEILDGDYQEIDYDEDVEDIAELLLAGINYDANIKCKTDLRYL